MSNSIGTHYGRTISAFHLNRLFYLSSVLAVDWNWHIGKAGRVANKKQPEIQQAFSILTNDPDCLKSRLEVVRGLRVCSWCLVKCTMAHITGNNRSQLLLLPDAVDDYVGPDNPVRFIDAFVDSLDLEASGFQRVRPNDMGRPGYDPADLLKLYIYGYLNRVRSSRRLEAETHRNLEVIWLLRRLTPDFKTIADFRRDNRQAFRQVFRAFVRLCRELDLYGRELVAVDGTRIKAVNHRDRNFTQAKLKRGPATYR